MAQSKSKKKKRTGNQTKATPAPGQDKSVLKAAQAEAEKRVAASESQKSKTSGGKSKAAAKKKPNVFKRLIQYFVDVKAELKRVTWPTKHEVLNSSLVVIAALVFFGVLIFLVDTAAVQIMTAYSGLAG